MKTPNTNLLWHSLENNTGTLFKPNHFHIACQYGHLQIVQYLNEIGANIEAKY